jgi:hypothetical protein
MFDFTISGHRSPLSFPEVTNTERYVITSDLGARALDILIQKTTGITAGLTYRTLREVLSAKNVGGRTASLSAR